MVSDNNEDVQAVSFSPDGRYIATASGDNTVRIWDSQSGTEIVTLNHSRDERSDPLTGQPSANLGAVLGGASSPGQPAQHYTPTMQVPASEIDSYTILGLWHWEYGPYA